MAGASLLVDYILTVAVSISAGVAAIVSIPTFQGLADQRVLMCLVLIAFITVANLRGVKESGKLFALPTYLYIVTLGGMLAHRAVPDLLRRHRAGPVRPRAVRGRRARSGGSLSLFLLLRGFSSGAVALSGVEAISNGVPAFRKPEAKNAATTLMWMAAILGTLFFGISVLAHHLQPYPDPRGDGALADGPGGRRRRSATTGCCSSPPPPSWSWPPTPPTPTSPACRRSSPATATCPGSSPTGATGWCSPTACSSWRSPPSGLIVAFGGITTALIPLYAIGVFTSFTLSQAGMVRHHLQAARARVAAGHRDQRRRRGGHGHRHPHRGDHQVHHRGLGADRGGAR